MDISHLKKEVVLAALYNGSKVQGMGWLQAKSEPMTESEAKKLLDESDNKYFDYVHGKVMKISLKHSDLNTFLYNRDNGDNAAENIISKL